MKCSFCKINIEKGKGKMYVKKSGQKLYFCSGKCEKNMLKLKRKARKTRWTEEFRKEKEGKTKK